MRGSQSSTQPDDTQAQQFLTHGHPSRDSTHRQRPHPGLHSTACCTLWSPLPFRTRETQREEGAVAPHPGLGGKPRRPEKGGTLHAEEEALISPAPPCSALHTPSLCWPAPCGPSTLWTGGKLALTPTRANFLSHVTPFASGPHTWQSILGFPATRLFHECPRRHYTPPPAKNLL